MMIAEKLSSLLQIDKSHRVTSWLFLRLLAIIYFIAFASLAVQINGLVGPDGILPFQEFLDNVYQRFGSDAYWRFPNIFWFNAGDLALHGATFAGIVLSVSLFLGLYERLSLILMYVLYLSLTMAGQTFLTFQWDVLLLESGFLAIFLAAYPSLLVVFLLEWLLFRLRFLSGISKLLSGDPSWFSLKALDYYFETQPLPHIGSWYAHHLPEILLRTGTGLTLFAEIIVPFFIFLPRPFRIVAAVITIILQLLIIATSNHNWINILTIVLCLFLLDDKIISRILPKKLGEAIVQKTSGRKPGWGFALAMMGSVVFAASLVTMYDHLIGKNLPPRVFEMANVVRHYGLGHVYHVFPTMQTERQELEIQGSNDGREWKTYVFKYKPGPIDRAPVFNLPHQPRLDWLMWFVPPKFPDQLYWFDRFMRKLAQGEEKVTDLLETNPFRDKPPRYLRVLAYRYHFTTPKEHEETGFWWRRELLGEFPNTPARHP